MKNKLIGALLLVICAASLAMAEWVDDFNQSYFADGIDEAVKVALEDGRNPTEIMEAGLGLEGLSSVGLIKAMYCAGIAGTEIQQAATSYNITELDLVTGYKKGVNECFSRIVDSEAYSPSAPVNFRSSGGGTVPGGGGGGTGGGSGGSGGGGGGRPASPSTF
mgnify:FL=1